MARGRAKGWTCVKATSIHGGVKPGFEKTQEMKRVKGRKYMKYVNSSGDVQWVRQYHICQELAPAKGRKRTGRIYRRKFVGPIRPGDVRGRKTRRDKGSTRGPRKSKKN